MQHLRTLTLALALGPVLVHSAMAQVYERIDVGTQGQLGNARADYAEISDDGRYVAFQSSATNFGVPYRSIYLRDRVLATTTPLPLAELFNYRNPRISRDGNRVTFTAGLFPARAFLHDRPSGVTSEILVPGLLNRSITGLDRTGTYAALTARTAPNAPDQVYRLNLVTGAVVLCSRDAAGNPVGGADGDIDAYGKMVAFTSTSAQIVPGDANGTADVFAYDVPGNVMVRASVSASGGDPDATSPYPPSIDADGRYVAFVSYASNVVLPDTNNRQDVFVRDLRLNTTVRASSVTSGAELLTGTADAPQISADASSVAFVSAEGLAPLDLPITYSWDVFMRDVQTGILLPVSPGTTYGGFTNVRPLGLTRDGRAVLFASEQPGMTQSLDVVGIFVADFGPRCSTSGYCTSLPNSTGAPATIGAQGDASRALNNLVIAATGLPDGANALLVSGASAVDPGAPFGNGLLCIGGGMIRHGVHVADGGVILDAQDLNAPEYAGVHPGDTRCYQIFYRDPAAGGALFNTTDAVSVTFCW